MFQESMITILRIDIIFVLHSLNLYKTAFLNRRNKKRIKISIQLWKRREMPYISYTGPIGTRHMFQKGTITIVRIDIIFALRTLNRIKQPCWSDETKTELNCPVSYDNEGKRHIFRIPSLLEKDKCFKKVRLLLFKLN